MIGSISDLAAGCASSPARWSTVGLVPSAPAQRGPNETSRSIVCMTLTALDYRGWSAMEGGVFVNAAGGIRTHTPFRAMAFETIA